MLLFAVLLAIPLGLEAVLSFGVIILTLFALKYGANNKALVFKPIGYIGNISYSLCLVHWPVVVFITLYGIDTKSLIGSFFHFCGNFSQSFSFW
jgi:peptidoglycan/LPS O-acetylase OafA/YrhL